MLTEPYKFKVLVWDQAGLLLDLKCRDKAIAEEALANLIRAKNTGRASFTDAYIAEVKN